jgi:hypothetical protein
MHVQHAGNLQAIHFRVRHGIHFSALPKKTLTQGRPALSQARLSAMAIAR